LLAVQRLRQGDRMTRPVLLMLIAVLACAILGGWGLWAR
jgi:hypothetical protein